MQLHYYTTNIPFQYPFTISGGRTKTHQPALVVVLALGNITGVGEAPAITYYNVSVEGMIASLNAKRSMIEKFAFTTPERFWHFLHHLLPKDPFLVCALDMAGWDLYGKMRNKLLKDMWPAGGLNPPTNYTIGIDPIEVMLNKMKAHPWPIYKVKVGTEDDVARLTALRAHTDAAIRIDANGGWTVEQTLAILPVLEKLNIELVEQPIAKDNLEGMKPIRAATRLPLIADESCVFEQDVKKMAPYFTGINIKLTKCSGITPALRMIKEARSLGLSVMMGCMNENVIGTAALVNFCPQLDQVDMDGPLLQTDANAAGLAISMDGRAEVHGRAGLGITPSLPAQLL